MISRNFYKKKVWVINNDYLKLPLLLIRVQEQKLAWEDAKQNKVEPTQIKHLKHQYYKSQSEIFKRASIALAVITFTLMGTSFGISIGRNRSSKSLFFVIFLTVLYLVAFFLAKGIEQNRNVAVTLYMVPHIIIILCSLFLFKLNIHVLHFTI